MSLKRLYILLSVITIVIFLSGASFIYLDGKNRIKTELYSSKVILQENKEFLDFFSNYKEFAARITSENTVSDLTYKNLLTSVEEIEYLNIPSINKFNKSLKELKPLGHLRVQYKKNLELLLNKEREKQLELEKTLSSAIVIRLKKGQEFLPGLKKTLANWGKDISFFNKIKQGLDVSYVDKKKFGELRSLMKLSEDLIKSNYDLSKIDLVRYQFSKYLRVQIEISLELLEKAIAARIDKEREIENISSQIRSKVKYLDGLVNTHFLEGWLNYTKTNERLTLEAKHKKHKLVLNTVTSIGILMILMLLIVFLKIFPYLSKLERRADEISNGDFEKRFQKVPNNEIGRLMFSFNNMADHISKYIEQIKIEKEKQANLSESIQSMKKLNAMSELASKMSHEIKNPIAILKFCINDASEYVEKGDLIKIKAELSKSNQALDRLSVVASKLGSRATISNFEDLNINLVLEEVIHLYGQPDKIKFQKPLESLTINGPRIEIQSAISNLLDNAIEYSSELIEVQVFKENQNVCIEVKNPGEELYEPTKIFNNFYSTKSGPSRGLGLSIVKDIVELSGGHINYRYENSLHIFKIEFPVC